MKTKNIIKIVLVCFVAIIFLWLINFIFKKEHIVNYQINKDGNNYSIEEHYVDNRYNILISLDDYKFSLEVNNKYNKKKKIINDIKYYESGNLKCIYLPDTDTNIVCSDKEYNYSYQTSLGFISSFVDELKAEGYSNNSWDDYSKTSERIGSATVYKDNIPLDAYLYVYKYNGLYAINHNKLDQLNLFDSDNYYNNFAYIIDKYYITVNYDEKYNYSKIYIIDITNNNKKEIVLKNGLSKESYILGDVDNKLYIFDPDSVMEYEIDPKKRKVNVIASKDMVGKFYDGSWKDINIYDFKTTKLEFNYNYGINREYNYIDLCDNLYYYLADENIYKYNSITDVSTLLVSMQDISNMYVIRGDVYFLRNNTLFLIRDGFVLEILSYEELIFNNENRIFIYQK